MTQLDTPSCPACGTQVAADMLACPSCGRLLYADRLTELAQTAEQATQAGDFSSALASWREALTLLPPRSRQFEIISAKITELGSKVQEQPAPGPKGHQQSAGGRAVGAMAALSALAWKFKVLLVGLSKGTTLLSMLLSLGVYWSIWGWKFALGLVLSIYVHEMGHVIALRRYGFKATAPVFIPGLGALIRLQQQVVNPFEDAAIGLAGPLYGLGAALVVAGIWLATKQPIFAAIAGVGAWINLFNLLPIGTLDGGRGFHSLSRGERFIAAAAVGIAWYLTGDGMLMVLGIICIGRALGEANLAVPQSEARSKRVLATYIFLVAALSALAMMRKLAPDSV